MGRSGTHRYPMVKTVLKTHVCRVLQPEFSLNFTPKRSREATPKKCYRTEGRNCPSAIEPLQYSNDVVHTRYPFCSTAQISFTRDLQRKDFEREMYDTSHICRCFPLR
jgi:hypothetical protein